MWPSQLIRILAFLGALSLESHAADLVPGTRLKILPLGDSITYGWMSTDGNGYRNHLYNHLLGSDMEFVGNVAVGNMTMNRCDCYAGRTIKRIRYKGRSNFGDRPNVVLLHAGTNDMMKHPPPESYEGAPMRLGILIDDVFCANPNATMLVAQIIPINITSAQSRIDTFNAAIPRLVADRYKRGYKIMTVDATSVNSRSDYVHPDDEGYRQLAEAWYNGLKRAASYGWITDPDPPIKISADTECGLPSGNNAVKAQDTIEWHWWRSRQNIRVREFFGKGDED